MHADWQRVLGKMRRVEPVEVAVMEAKASGQMYHYFVSPAHEQTEPREALRLLERNLAHSPPTRLRRAHTRLLAAACLSKMILPDSLHCQLERSALGRWEGTTSLTSIRGAK